MAENRRDYGEVVRTGGPEGCLKVDSVKGRHTNAPARGTHVGGPLMFAASGRIEVKAPREFHSGESVNDNHRGAAVGAVPVGVSLRGSPARRRRRSLASSCRQSGRQCGSESVGEKTKMADSHESLRQHVQEEAAQELRSQQRHLALLAAVGVVLPSEGDAFSIECQEPMIGDGDPMGVSAEITQDLRRAAEGGFGIDHPVLPVQVSQKLDGTVWLSQARRLGRRSAVAAAIEAFQAGDRTCRGKRGSGPSPAGRMDSGDAPSGCGPETVRPPESRNERADGTAGSVPKCAEC